MAFSYGIEPVSPDSFFTDDEDPLLLAFMSVANRLLRFEQLVSFFKNAASMPNLYGLEPVLPCENGPWISESSSMASPRKS